MPGGGGGVEGLGWRGKIGLEVGVPWWLPHRGLEVLVSSRYIYPELLVPRGPLEGLHDIENLLICI